MLRHILILVLVSCVAGCSSTKHLPKDERLYKGATVDLKGDSLTARDRKVLRSNMQALTRPKPNSAFLGLPFKLWLWNFFGGDSVREGSVKAKLRDKLGQRPVLLSEVDLKRNTKVLSAYLQNKGFFKGTVTGDTVVKARTAKAIYKSEAGPLYRIAAVAFEQDSSELSRTIQATAPNTLLRVNDPFDLDVIKTERIRIDAYLKEHGFYYFSPEFLLVKVDSTIGGTKVNLYVTFKPDAPASARRAYKINDVFIYSNYSLNTANIDTNRANATNYKGYYIVDPKNTYKPRLLENTMQFKPGETYNRNDHNVTLNRLINLNLFKFVKNRFEPVTWSDSPRLNAYYYLTPLPKKTLRSEITGLTKSNNSNGSEITFSWRNRNTFRGGEQLSLSAYIGSEIQMGGSLRGYNTYRTGAEATLTLPKFLAPFVDIRNEGAFAPRTVIQLGYDVLNRRQLYTLNSFRGQYGYTWKRGILRQHEFYPVAINYVQPLNITPLFNANKDIPSILNPVQRQFILGSYYRFNYNGALKNTNARQWFFFNGLADVSGNVAGLIKPGNVKAGDTAFLFNAPYAQYIKLETDVRYFRKIGLQNTWANRIIVGWSNPYGNSAAMPFIKQFFAGGNNSLRAFRSRLVGPGTYLDTSRLLVDQTGDYKLELNTEYRPHISGPLYGALFVDAGNVWLKNADPKKPGAEFTNKFLSQLAVGAGVGIRVDVVVFVIRLDAAFPLRKPWLQNPWVLQNIDPINRNWRRENVVYNLAIGYPF